MQTAFGRTTFSTPGRISREPRGGEETGETAGESAVIFGILDDLVRGAPAPAGMPIVVNIRLPRLIGVLLLF